MGAHAQVVKDFVPVTEDMLLDPSPDDWLMYSRTYDAQRFSPLKQVNRANVGQLRMAWTRGLGPGPVKPFRLFTTASCTWLNRAPSSKRSTPPMAI